MQSALLFLVVVAFIPRAAAAQGEPLGPEFRVNTYTTSGQADPFVASDPSGNLFVVVWSSDTQDGSNLGIFGQRFTINGAPLGPEFRVNTYTTNNQFASSAAVDLAGNFVVVWQSFGQDGSNYGIFGQRYDSSGAPLGPEFRVNTYTTSYQALPSVTTDAAGNFVVAWLGNTPDGSSAGVFGQRFASSGVPLGPEFGVNTHTPGLQRLASVASDGAGNFVVVWMSDSQDGSGEGVFGQRYASSGTPVGPEFRVNTFTTNSQYFPTLASLGASGDFVVVWQSYVQDGSSNGVFGQRFSSSGAPLGPEFRVNTFTPADQARPAVAADSAGDFVVAWQSETQDGSSTGVFGQRFASSGAPLGSEFRVNTYTANYQDRTAVAADSPGNFVVVWASDTQDGSGPGIFGQRYSQIVPVELMHFRVE